MAIPARQRRQRPTLVPPDGPPSPPLRARVPLSKETLIELCINQRLTATEVGARLGCSSWPVLAALDRYGIPVRPSGTPRSAITLDEDEIIAMYARERLSTVAIAKKVGSSPKRVRGVLVRHGVALRFKGRGVLAAELDRTRLTELYVDARLSDQEIAALYQVSTRQVNERRLQLDIHRHPARRSLDGVPPAAVLRALHVDQGLALDEVGRRYGVSTSTAGRWMVKRGVPVAARTSRASRKQLAVDTVAHLYVEQKLTAAETAEQIGGGVSQNDILRALHDHRHPVRPPGRRPFRRTQPHIKLLSALYRDPAIAAALAAHGITCRRRPGPLARRFPVPVALTAELLLEFYQTIGLSARSIELLTGHPAAQILVALHSANIEVRGSGPSPWMRRYVGSLQKSRKADRSMPRQGPR